MTYGAVGSKDWLTDRQYPVFTSIGPRNNESEGGNPGENLDTRYCMFLLMRIVYGMIITELDLVLCLRVCLGRD